MPRALRRPRHQPARQLPAHAPPPIATLIDDYLARKHLILLTGVALLEEMDYFIATLDDARLQDRLWRAIRGREAFRRFKDLVARHPDVQEQWYAYKDAQTQKRLLRWLNAHDIEPITQKKQKPLA